MKILILGATGRTGKHVLEEALRQGYDVHCLLREPSKININHPKLNLFQGSPENIPDLQSAIQNCEAIISVLNISRSSDFPWSKLRTPKNFLSQVIKNLVLLIQEQNLKRIVVCSAWGVFETKSDIPFWFRWIINHSNIGIAYKDHERQEEELIKSTLDWTIVRPTGLVNFKRTNRIVESYDNNPRPKLWITREDLARFMVNALNRKDLVGKQLVVSN